MAVANELTRSSTSRSHTETINDIVEAALEKLDQDLTGNTFGTSSFREEKTELTLEYTVGVFSFLLLSELSTILRVFLTTVNAVLSGCVRTFCKHLILAEDSLAETACDARFWANISCHNLKF